MNNLRKNSLYKIIIPLFAVASAILQLIISIPIFGADTLCGESACGTPGNPAGGACLPGGYTGKYYDSCYGGVGWRKYPVTSNAIPIPGNSSGTIPSDTVVGCGEGGLNTDYFYRLGYEQFNAVNGHLKSYTGQQAGLVDPYKVLLPADDWHRHRYAFDSPGVLTWNEAYNLYLIAKDHGVPTDWEHSSAFCWNDSWLGSTLGSFSSVSTISVPAQEGISDAKSASYNNNSESNVLTVYTTSETATFSFSHQLNYLAPTETGSPTYNDISTTFNITGQNIYTSITTTSGTFGPINGGVDNSSPKYNESQTFLATGLEVDVPRTYCESIGGYKTTVNFKKEGENHFVVDNYSGSGVSMACVTFIRSGGSPTEPAGSGKIWAVSQVTIPIQNDVTSPISRAVSSENHNSPSATITLSTDADSIELQFTHKLFASRELYDYSAYNPADGAHAVSSADTFPDISVSYNINGAANSTASTSTSLHPLSEPPRTFYETSTPHSVTITDIGLGATKMYCETFYHDHRTVTLSREHKDNPASSDDSDTDDTADPDDTDSSDAPSSTHDKYAYSVENYSGTSTTSICVNVYRPANPSGSGAVISANPVFAGQEVTIDYEASASSHLTRAIIGQNKVSFVVNASANLDSADATGNRDVRNTSTTHRANTAPCAYFEDTTRFGSHVTWCEEADSDDAHTSIHRIAPDYTGYKLCGSFAYQWQYRYNITGIPAAFGDGTHNGSQYWTTYSATCRPIAKKPSVAAWNGGVFTTDTITTSLAMRYNITSSAQAFELSGYGSTHFGAWSEYLATVGGANAQFGSAAVFANGGNSGDYKNLSISEDSGGNSGITANSTLVSRLHNYFRDNTTEFPPESLSNLTSTGTLFIADNDTHVYHSTGDLHLSRNIEVSGTHSSPYTLPRVLIFVDGDLEIAPSVTRLDAWLIVDGSLDTCSAATSDNETQADGYTANRACDNQLVFNGPVLVGGAVNLNRTYGADPIVQAKRSEPAEIFNYSLDNYLWAYAQAGRLNSSYTEAYIRELPPRY